MRKAKEDKRKSRVWMWSQLKRLVPQKALEHKLHHMVGSLLRPGCQPFVCPCQSSATGCLGGGGGT